MTYYKLDESLNPQPCSGSLGRLSDEYYAWYDSMPEQSDWYSKKTGIGFVIGSDHPVPGVHVSTVYLAMDHGWGQSSKPVLWETMIFCDDKDSQADMYQERYTSHAEAKERHDMLCRLIASEGLDALTDRGAAT